jgi:dCMP deaminase
MYTEHAERNAIFCAARHGIRLLDSSLYVTGGGMPCADCVRAVIQAGIIEVVGMDSAFCGQGDWLESCRIGEEMLIEAGVKVVLLNDKYERTVVKFKNN